MRARIVYSLIFFGVLCNTYIFNSQTSRGLMVLVFILPILSITLTWISSFFLIFSFTSGQIEVERSSQFNCQLTIQNSSVLVLPFVEILLHSEKGVEILLEKGLRTSIDSKETVRISLPCKAISRGMHSVEIKKIFVVDYLGLFKISVSLEQQKNCKVLVLPRLVQTFLKLNIPLGFTEKVNIKRVSTSSEIVAIKDSDMGEELRKFRPGDSMKSIHWKLYSKTNELMVRSSEKSNSNTILISMLPWISTVENITYIGDKVIRSPEFITECEDILVEYLLAIVKHLLSKGNIIKLWIYSKNSWNSVILSAENNIYELQILLLNYEFEVSGDGISKRIIKDKLERNIKHRDETSILEGFDDGTMRLNNKVVTIR